MPETLLTTKLFAPSTRPELVSRSRLIEQLNNGTHHKLTLISAPAGFGKTTLISDWVGQIGLKVAWLSLDEKDNDPIRFLKYLIAGLKRANGKLENFSADLITLTQSPKTPPLESILTSLINQIATLQEDWILVLDDFHLIESESVQNALSFLLENAPYQLHIVIITREDPHLPLARLRARDQLTELRAADLRFTNDEAAIFLNQVMRLELNAEELAALESRTEGWIAGLQLAAISLKDRPDTVDSIQAFTNSNRHVMDYLLEDVLSKQSEEIQTFLLQTSILERFNETLCNTVTGRDASQTVLNFLDQANLFIIPLDNERNWYRYHHLFAALLQQRLISENPGLVDRLHARAMEWYETQNLLEDAIHHALEGADIQTAVRLVEKGAENALERSDFGFIFNSVESLPEDRRTSSAWLLIYYFWALILTGEVDLVEQHLQDTDWLEDSISDFEERKKMRGYLAGVKSFYYSWKWDDQQMFEYARQAFECLPDNHWVLGYCSMMMGAAYWGTGELNKAIEVFRQAETIGKSSGHMRVIVTSTMYLAHSLEQQGHLRKAQALCQNTFALTESDGRRMRLAGYMHIDLARLFYQMNELDKALQHVTVGIGFCQQLGDSRVEKLGLYQLGLIKLAQGKLKNAEAILREAEKVHPGHEPFTDMRGLEYPLVRVWLAQDNFKLVEDWLNRNKLTPDDLSFFKAKLITTMHARAMISLGREYKDNVYLTNSLDLLGELVKLADENGWKYKEIEIRILQALCLQEQGKFILALETLGQALNLAEPKGIVRMFVDEGPPVLELLKKLKPTDTRQKDFLVRLLSAFGAKEMSDQPLIDPLSDRELEVLELIAAGYTNSEIASRLYLSLNTVKVHTRNIYQKLDSNNRTQAAAKARELGIIPS